MRGAPHSRFARAIWAMSSRTSVPTRGRPPRQRPSCLRPKTRLRPCRRHLRTVPGWTMIKEPRQRDHRRDSISQNSRSQGVSRGRRVPDRWSTRTWCCRARCSKTRSQRSRRHRQGFPTSSGGSPARPERRLPKAFGRRRPWLAMPRIAAPRAPGRKPWEAVSMSHYQRSLVSDYHGFAGSGFEEPQPACRAVRGHRRCCGCARHWRRGRSVRCLGDHPSRPRAGSRRPEPA